MTAASRQSACVAWDRRRSNEPDFIEFLAELLRARARFLVVGAHALAVHGVVRATVDIDVWIDRSRENAERVWRALHAFGAPVEAPGVSLDDLTKPDTVLQVGLPPRRIDVLTDVSGLTSFDLAWDGRTDGQVGEILVPFLGRAELVQNKRASGRHKDISDAELLEVRGKSV